MRCHQVLKACLNLDDGALSWVMSQILAQKGPVVQEASLHACPPHCLNGLSNAPQVIGHEEETHPQESVRSRSKASNRDTPTSLSLPMPACICVQGITTWSSEDGSLGPSERLKKFAVAAGFFSAPPCTDTMKGHNATCSGRLRN